MSQSKKAPVSEQETTQAGSAEATGDEPARIAQIEAELDQTRNAISGDLRTLGERLSPEHLKAEAKEVLAEAKNAATETLHEAKDIATSAFKEAKDSAMDTVSTKVEELRDNVRRAERETISFLRENALPLGLIGVGVAWFLSNRRSSEQRWDRSYDWRSDGNGRPMLRDADPYRGGSSPGLVDGARESVAQVADRARDLGAQAKGRAGRWVDDAGRSVGEAAERVRGFTERELEQAGKLAKDTEQRIEDAAGRARDFAGKELREAREFSRHTVDAHPLAVGAAAVAAGIGVGLLLPSTRREAELLGPQRERLFSEAKDRMQDWTQTAKDTARDVKQTLSGAT